MIATEDHARERVHFTVHIIERLEELRRKDRMLEPERMRLREEKAKQGKKYSNYKAKETLAVIEKERELADEAVEIAASILYNLTY